METMSRPRSQGRGVCDSDLKLLETSYPVQRKWAFPLGKAYLRCFLS
jgi:hypothetical protein